MSSTLDKATRTYTAGGKTGAGLKVTMDIVVANQAFIETSGAPLQNYINSKLLSDTTGSTLVPSVQFIPTYIRHKMASRFAACGNNCSYTERDTAFSANVSVEVTE